MYVWENTMDNGAWHVLVKRVTDYQGLLEITDARSGMVVHSEPTSLSYGARFGADIGDVMEWQDIAVRVIDNPSERSIYKP